MFGYPDNQKCQNVRPDPNSFNSDPNSNSNVRPDPNSNSNVRPDPNSLDFSIYITLGGADEKGVQRVFDPLTGDF